MSKTWFITGTSRGFGRVWAEAALARGDKVVATARSPKTLEALTEKYGDSVLALELDVTQRDAVFGAIEEAKQKFGVIDVVVNNAGYGLFGAIEDVTAAQAREQMETNFFGMLWVTQAAMPVFREQGHGHFLNVSSIGGIAAFPLLGMYHASKWAMEGMSEALAGEVADLGIKVTLIEPGPFSTDWRDTSSDWADTSEPYQHLVEARKKSAGAGAQGDPNATADAVLQVVDSDKPPLRLFLGASAFDVAKAKYAERIETWEAWADVSRAAQGS